MTRGEDASGLSAAGQKSIRERQLGEKVRDRKMGETVTAESEDFGEIFQKFSLWKRVPVENILRSPAVRWLFLFLFLSPFIADFPAPLKN